MKKSVKLGIGGVILVGLIVAVVLGLKGGKKGVEVRTEEVQKRDLVASVTANGKVQARTKVDIAEIGRAHV